VLFAGSLVARAGLGFTLAVRRSLLMRTSEKELDDELALLLRDNPNFQKWFLGKTRFANRASKCVLSRSDHPWTTVTIEVIGAATGETESIRRQGKGARLN
jgi:hypothetical protein